MGPFVKNAQRESDNTFYLGWLMACFAWGFSEVLEWPRWAAFIVGGALAVVGITWRRRVARRCAELNFAAGVYSDRARTAWRYS